MEIRRGRPGTRDPRRKSVVRTHASPWVLRLPSFVREPRYVFPPVEITYRPTSPTAGPSRALIVRDDFNSPPCPWELKLPPSIPLPPPRQFINIRVPLSSEPGVAEEARGASPAVPEDSPVARRPELAQDSTPPPSSSLITEPDSGDTLYCCADETPEQFSPSPPSPPSPGPPPAKRFKGNSHCRNLRF